MEPLSCTISILMSPLLVLCFNRFGLKKQVLKTILGSLILPAFMVYLNFMEPLTMESIIKQQYLEASRQE